MTATRLSLRTGGLGLPDRARECGEEARVVLLEPHGDAQVPGMP